MHTVTSLPASALRPDELSGVLRDYLALERVRTIRRLLVIRCGLLAVAATVVGPAFHWLSPFASWFSVGTFVALPTCAWAVEIRRNVELGRRLEDLPGAATEIVTKA